MADHRPPLLDEDERATLTTSLRFQRESLLRCVHGVGEEDARHSPVGSGTSLIWLVRHVRRAELIWISHRFADEGLELPDPSIDDGTLADAIDAYRATWAHVDAVVAAASLDDVTRNPGDDPPVNLRWILVHLVEEIARHAGHADILRELLDGTTGR
jgi:Protein of unknown function (DUF664)